MSLNAGGENWSEPVNLGDQINTPFIEISPFYDARQRALFFSSDGHRGFGGFDIFMAKGASFFDPEIFNPGSPFNSNKDEVFMFINQHKGYLSSNRDGGFGKLDIYQFEIAQEKEIITEYLRINLWREEIPFSPTTMILTQTKWPVSIKSYHVCWHPKR